jgi:hypothetical protein
MRQTGVRLPAALYTRAKVFAARNGMTFQGVVTAALVLFLDRNNKQSGRQTSSTNQPQGQ